MFGLLDRLAVSLLAGFDSWFISEAEIEADRAETRDDGIHPSLFSANSEDALDRIDTKAGSLLTHISMMVAAASFMISTAETSRLEKVIVGIEIGAYLFFALLCLRCLAFSDLIDSKRHGSQTQNLKMYQRETRREVLIRSKLIGVGLRWVFLITFVFMLTVLLHLIL